MSIWSSWGSSGPDLTAAQDSNEDFGSVVPQRGDLWELDVATATSYCDLIRFMGWKQHGPSPRPEWEELFLTTAEARLLAKALSESADRVDEAIGRSA